MHDEKTMKFSGMYRGLIVNNLDEYYLGRCQIRIYPMLNDVEDSNLPWATPATSIGSGAGIGFGNFSVPEIGSMVFCFFEGEDIYQPVYFAQAPDAVNGIVGESLPDYPQSRGFKTAGGTSVVINDAIGDLTVIESWLFPKAICWMTN